MDAAVLTVSELAAGAAAAASEQEVVPEGATTAVVSSLRVLDVSHCPRVTGRGISALARACPVLVKLFLSGCDLDDDTYVLLRVRGGGYYY